MNDGEKLCLYMAALTSDCLQMQGTHNWSESSLLSHLIMETLHIKNRQPNLACREASSYGSGSPKAIHAAGILKKLKTTLCFTGIWTTFTFMVFQWSQVRQSVDEDTSSLFKSLFFLSSEMYSGSWSTKSMQRCKLHKVTKSNMLHAHIKNWANKALFIH